MRIDCRLREILSGTLLWSITLLGNFSPGEVAASTLESKFLVTSGGGVDLRGARIYFNKSFVGFFGDMIPLQESVESIDVYGPNLSLFSVSLQKSEPFKKITSSNYRDLGADNCVDPARVPTKIRNWEDFAISYQPNKPQIVILNLGKIQFDKRPPPNCFIHSSIVDRDKIGSIKMKIKSDPKHAQIFVREQLTGTTDMEIIVPYFQNETSIGIVIRRGPGWPNCMHTLVRPYPQSDEIVCMEKPPPSP